jgi:hypothetical protein
MAGIAAPIIGLAGSLFNGIYGGNRSRRVGEMIANTNEGASNDIIAATGAGQGAVANAGNNAITAATDGRDAANNILSPYVAAGTAGVDQLTQMATNPAKFSYADYANDPAFQFEMEQGANAINHNAAARGLASSGNVLKDLTKYGQGLAATYYNDAFDRYIKGRGLQQAAATTLTNAGSNAAAQTANNYTNTGQYVGNTGMDVAQFFANFGMQGQNLAANYRVAGQNARGAGLLGQSNAVTGMVNQASQTLPQVMQPIFTNSRAGGPSMSSLPLQTQPWAGASSSPRNPLTPW